MTTIDVRSVTITRVLYTDAVVPFDDVGLTSDVVAMVSWLDDRWADGDGVRVGAAAWVIASGDRLLVIDPFRNADEILHDPETAGVHYEAIMNAFATAGISTGDVTDVVLSHVEGLGVIAGRDGDGWKPFFPNATLRLGTAALADFQRGTDGDWTMDVLSHLLDTHPFDTYDDGDELAPNVRAEHTGAHNPGHYVFHIGDAPEATCVGHLAVTPLHLSTGLCEPQHDDAAAALDALGRFAQDERILFGPLWPSPGAGRLIDGRFVPVDAVDQR